MNEKKALIFLNENNSCLSNIDLQKLFKTKHKKEIGLSTITDILNNKENIKNLKNSNSKKISIPIFLNLEEQLFEFINKLNSKNLPITEDVISTKAKDISEFLKIENFKLSRG